MLHRSKVNWAGFLRLILQGGVCWRPWFLLEDTHSRNCSVLCWMLAALQFYASKKEARRKDCVPVNQTGSHQAFCSTRECVFFTCSFFCWLSWKSCFVIYRKTTRVWAGSVALSWTDPGSAITSCYSNRHLHLHRRSLPFPRQWTGPLTFHLKCIVSFVCGLLLQRQQPARACAGLTAKHSHAAAPGVSGWWVKSPPSRVSNQCWRVIYYRVIHDCI